MMFTTPAGSTVHTWMNKINPANYQLQVTTTCEYTLVNANEAVVKKLTHEQANEWFEKNRPAS